MLKPYRTIDDVLRSPWASLTPPMTKESTDRVLRSTKLEDSIYADLREGDGGLDQIELRRRMEEEWKEEHLI